MSAAAVYLSIVAEVLNMPATEAAHVPLVLGNHAIACYYEKHGKKYSFTGAGRLTE